MKHALLFCLSLSGCAHAPAPPTFAFGAIECREVRDVACLLSAAFDAELCATTVAVRQVNEAVGRRLFRYVPPVTEARSEDAIFAGVFLFGEAPLPKGILGLTSVREYGHCITATYTLLSADMLAGKYGDSADLESVVLHEMLHGLGAGHADAPGRSFGSVMSPAVDGSNYLPALSDLDKATLRGVYGRHF